MIYLDNSATTYPKPQGVRQAVQRSFIEQGANPGRSGYGMCLSTTRAVYRVRQLAPLVRSASCSSPAVPRR